MKVYHFLICSLFLLGFTACSSDNDLEEETSVPEQKTKYLPMSIEIGEKPLVDPNAQKSSMKRAPISYLSDLNSFFLIYNYGEGGTNYDSSASNCGAWEATKRQNTDGLWECGSGGEYGWPYIDDLDQQVTWYAFGNFNFNHGINGVSDDDGLYLDFEVDENPTEQSDLLVAKTKDSYNHKKGYLFFGFEHVCTALRFNVKKANNVSTHAISIKKVTLMNMYNRGSYNLETSSWNNDENKGNFTLFEAVDGKSLENVYRALYAGDLTENNENAYLFMIPQTTPTGAVIEIELTLDQESKTVSIPFGGQTFAKGYKYEVNLNIGKSVLQLSE